MLDTGSYPGTVSWWSPHSQWTLRYPKSYLAALVVSSEKWGSAGTLLPYKVAVRMNKSLVVEDLVKAKGKEKGVTNQRVFWSIRDGTV